MIDESMIWGCGCAVEFEQYAPCKPIKNGIKVFAVCCAVTAILLGFEVYVGAEDETESVAIGIVKRLIEGEGLMAVQGCILYTDNWYMSVTWARMLFEQYG